MKFELVNSPKIRLIGMSHNCSFAKYDVFNLWRSFMPRKSEVLNSIDTSIFSITYYPNNFFEAFNPQVEFSKVAALRTIDSAIIPDGMERFEIPEGLYFNFKYVGTAEAYPKLFEQILKEILPSNNLRLDNRPHYEILGANYKNNDPDSEEDIYIPVSIHNS